MRCDVCRRRLLACDDPRSPPPEPRAHLKKCPDCRRWYRRLVRIERHVPLLPVPPSSEGKDRLLARLMPPPPPRAATHPEPWWCTHEPIAPAGKAGSAPDRAEASPRIVWWRRPWAVRSGAAAAAAVLVACGVFIGLQFVRQPDGADLGPAAVAPPALPDKALAARVVEWDLRLAETDAPQQRVEALAEVAYALHEETLALSQAAEAADLGKLAGLYEKVLRDGVVTRARALPPGQRGKILDPIVERLARAEKQARQLASVPSPGSAALTQLAAAAAAADRDLRALMKEGVQ